jgi:hypothetical protein
VSSGSIGWGFVASALGYSSMFRLNLIPVAIAMAVYFVRKKGNVHDIAAKSNS